MITPEQFQEIGETLLPLLDDLTEWIARDMIERFMIRFGAMLLREDAGGYVLVAVVSFAAAVVITALCFHLRKKEWQGKDGADKPPRHEKEEKSQ